MDSEKMHRSSTRMVMVACQAKRWESSGVLGSRTGEMWICPEIYCYFTTKNLEFMKLTLW
jgi:hypothetical protein